MTDARVIKNCGTIELQSDGTLAFTGWHVQGGGDDLAANIHDAVIRLLKEKRAELGPQKYIEIVLR